MVPLEAIHGPIAAIGGDRQCCSYELAQTSPSGFESLPFLRAPSWSCRHRVQLLTLLPYVQRLSITGSGCGTNLAPHQFPENIGAASSRRSSSAGRLVLIGAAELLLQKCAYSVLTLGDFLRLLAGSRKQGRRSQFVYLPWIARSCDNRQNVANDNEL